MATKILPEASPAAQKLIFQRLESAWEQVDTAKNRVQALGYALELSAKQGTSADKYLLDMISDTVEALWTEVDGIFSDLRSDLGIKSAAFETEANHG